MICFPNAKINLGLAVTEKRPDGFHNLETCFYPIPLTDVLEFEQSTQFELTLYGAPIAGSVDDNLLSRVWKLMNLEFGIPPVKVALLKQIPSGAGLGGGSADAAFFIKELNAFFNLSMTVEHMERIALNLGSDCPFFIRNTPALASGRGEVMTDIDLSLSGYYLTVVFPGLFISTAEAFRKIVPRKPQIPLQQVLQLSPDQWKNKLVNDFQSIVIEMFPRIGNLIDQLEQSGAFYAALSGSGSAVFALSKSPLSPFSTDASDKVFSWKL